MRIIILLLLGVTGLSFCSHHAIQKRLEQKSTSSSTELFCKTHTATYCSLYGPAMCILQPCPAPALLTMSALLCCCAGKVTHTVMPCIHSCSKNDAPRTEKMVFDN